LLEEAKIGQIEIVTKCPDLFVEQWMYVDKDGTRIYFNRTNSRRIRK
jgi:hypothetical protein